MFGQMCLPIKYFAPTEHADCGGLLVATPAPVVSTQLPVDNLLTCKLCLVKCLLMQQLNLVTTKYSQCPNLNMSHCHAMELNIAFKCG